MFSFALFILSGVVIAALVLAKMLEMRGGRPIFILKAVSKGDEQARDLYHKSLKFYSEGKVKFVFFVRKQLPVRAKIYTNKSLAWLEERFEERFGDIRNSRFIKREGISEFFKNISEIEKGVGELHDEVYVEPTLDEAPLAYRVTPTFVAEPVAIIAEEPVIEKATKPKKPRAPRKPRVKKVKVVEVSDTLEPVETV